MNQKWSLPLLLIGAALLMLTWLTDTRVFYHDDEWLYMMIAGEMFDRGEYWIPLWLGEPAYYKPPMTYWMMMAFFPFGADRLLLARLSIGLSSVGTVWLLFLLGRSLFRSSEAGFLAGVLAVSSLGFLSFGKIGMMEMPMALFMTAALYCFHRAWQQRSGYWAGCFLALTGASSLVKGPITVLILGLTALLLLAFYGRWRPFFSRGALWGGLVGLFFVALWPLALYFKGEFPRWYAFFIIGENFGKFADRLQYPIGPFLLYIPQWFLPWTFLLLAAVAWLAFHRHQLDFGLSLALIWALTTISIHLLPDTKLAWYMFLVVPPGTLLIGGVAARAKQSPLWRAGQLASAGLMIILAAVLAVPAVYLGLFHPAGPYLSGAGLLFLSAAWLLWRSHLSAGAATCLIALYCLVGAGTVISPPHYPPAAVVAEAAASGEVAVMRKQVYLYSYAFNKKVRQIVSPDQAVEVLERKGLVILGQQDWDRLLAHDARLTQRVSATAHSLQWKEQLPPALLMKALRAGDLTLLQENVYSLKL